jgi:hypothetical protein
MSHPLDNAIIFGSNGMGEVIQMTPLVAALKSPTLVVKECHLPIFNRLGWDVRTINSDEHLKGKSINLSQGVADDLGIHHRPWIAPIIRNGVSVMGVPVPAVEVNRRMKQHLSLTEKKMAEYGIEGSVSMHVSRVTPPSKERTLTIASSGEELRTVPLHVIIGLVKRLEGWKVNIVSKVAPLEIISANEGRNEIKFCYPSAMRASEFEATLATVQSSHAVVAADCGWAYAAIASGIKTFILQSHALFETLVPRDYWGLAEPVGPTKGLSCDRQCSAQKILAAMPEGATRPYPEFEDYRHMTPDWKAKYYIDGYPKTLACWGSTRPPCMDYDESTIDQLARQVLDALKP